MLVELQLPAAAVSAEPVPEPDPDPVPALDAELQALLVALGHDPVDVDGLAQRAGQDAAGVMGRLLTLELDGLVERLPGGLFQRTHKAHH